MIRSMSQQNRGVKRGGATPERRIVQEYFPNGPDDEFSICVEVSETHVEVRGRNIKFQNKLKTPLTSANMDKYDAILFPMTRYYAVKPGHDTTKVCGESSTLLFKLTDNGPREPDEYLFVGGEIVYTFRLLDEVREFHSPIGPRGVGTPWVVTEYSTLLMNYGYIIPNHHLDEDNDTPYDQEYDRWQMKITALITH
jgi:hypothetical protein